MKGLSSHCTNSLTARPRVAAISAAALISAVITFSSTDTAGVCSAQPRGFMLPGQTSQGQTTSAQASPEDALIDRGPFFLIERRNLWNTGWNINGLRADSVTVSFAELHGNFTSGGFHDTYQAARSWSAGAEARTITHLEKFSMYGSFSFDSFSGKEMCGSMSARPGYYPVDVLEFTPGAKTMQTYSFSGGITADLSRRWRLGGKISYTGANYTKRKDLRHANWLLDMTVSPSVMYHNDDFAAGLSYIFGKNSESIDAEELGISSTAYYAFLDKGLMYGAYEVWEGSGIHLSESGINGFPIKEIIHGAAAQIQWRGLYAEVSYLHGLGAAGEKQTIWFTFPEHRAGAKIGAAFGKEGNRHLIRLNLLWARQFNNENVIGQETQNGVTVTRIYGSNRILGRERFCFAPDYEWNSPGASVRFGAEISGLFRLSSQMYPYLFSRNDVVSRIWASGSVKIKAFDIKAGLAFSSGNSVEKSTTLDEDMVTGELPDRLQAWHDMQSEYLTAPRLDAALALRFNFLKGLYVEASASYVRGFNLNFLYGPDRWSESLKFGYAF